MRVIRLLSLRRLRLQPLRAVLAAVVVGAGASLVVSLVVLTTSLSQSVEEAGRSLAGPAPLRVIGPVPRGGVTPEAVSAIADTEGVESAVPLVQSITLVDPGERGTGDGEEISVMILGADCRIEGLVGEIGCDQEAAAALTVAAVGRGLADRIGPDAEVRTNLGRVPLADAVRVDDLNALNDGAVVAFPLAEAQRLLGRGDGVDLVYVVPEDGVAVAELQQRLERRLEVEDDLDQRVLDALDPPPLIGVVLANFLPLLSIISLLALGVGAVLVRNSITLSLEERRRQTAIVGALGGSSRLLVVGTIAEVAVLGAVGGLLGVLGGIAVAEPVSASMEDFTQKLAGIPIDVHAGPTAFVVALVVGIGVSVLAAVGPARRAVRIDVAAELASRGRRDEIAQGTSLRRLLLAVVLVFAGLGLCYVAQTDGGLEPWQATLAPGAFLSTTIAMVYVLATAVPILLRLVERRFRWRRGSTRLAFANLGREPRRTGVMAVALGFATAVGFITASFNASVTEVVTEQLSRNMTGVEVSSIEPDFSLNSEARLDPDVLRELGELPGVDRMERGAYLVAGNRPGNLVGVSAYTDPWLAGDIAAGRHDRARFEAGEVIIGPGLARSEGLRPGDLLTLDTPQGPVELPVLAVDYNGDFGGRNIQISWELMGELFGRSAPLTVIVEPERGTDDEVLARTVLDADLDPALQVRTVDEVIDRISGEVAEQLASFEAIQRGLLIMSFVAVLSTLLLVGIQRRREFGMLAAVGMTPNELRRMVITEAALVAVVGTAVAALGSLVQYGALLLITPVVIGYRNPFIIDPLALVQYAVVAIGVALLAALYPGHRAARVEVLDALRYE
ncbi:MAG: FtsX-like permease family protein [Acidimicrobiales bacterium]|nr:FtsX-like permease family protein [Acidimicrobiales bacterium]